MAKLLPGIRTHDYAAIDDAAFERFERNLAGHRRLDPELRAVDLALQRWAPWARPYFGQLGYPTRSVTERVHEGGILARDAGMPHSPEWPADVVEVDAHVARLPTRHEAAIMANYFHMALPAEERGRIYVGLARALAKQRPDRARLSRAATLGPAAFRADLDRARWTLKHALRA